MAGLRSTRALLAAGLLAGGGVGAQPPSLTEAVRVELVLVDVLVTDRDGRPVLDLEREELRLFEDGRPVEIAQFSPPDPRRPSADAQPDGPAAGRAGAGERYVVFLDELHLGPGSRRRALDQLRQAVDRLPPGVEMQLVSFDGAVRVDLPFTTDRRKLRKILEEKLGSAPPMMLAGFAEERLLELLPRALQIGVENARFLPREQVMEVVCSADLGPLVRSHAEQSRGRVERTAEALAGFVASLGGFDGRKVLLHVSDGIPLVAGQVAFEHAIELCDGSLAQQGLAGDVAPVIRDYPPAVRFPMTARVDLLAYSTAGAWERLAADANTYGVTFYPLQASGLQVGRGTQIDGARTSAQTDTVDRLNHQDTLFALARQTGGRAIFDTNDFRPDLEQMVADSSLRYELAFRPGPSLDGRLHRLRVEVTRDGLQLVHRRSYRSKSDRERATDRLLTALYHGRLDNPLRARIGLEPATVGEGKKRELLVELAIPIDSLTMLPGETELLGQVSVFLVARDELGNRTGIGEKTIALRMAPGDTDREYVYRVSMELPADHRYQVAAAIHDLLGGESSFLVAQASL